MLISYLKGNKLLDWSPWSPSNFSFIHNFLNFIKLWVASDFKPRKHFYSKLTWSPQTSVRSLWRPWDIANKHLKGRFSHHKTLPQSNKNLLMAIFFPKIETDNILWRHQERLNAESLSLSKYCSSFRYFLLRTNLFQAVKDSFSLYSIDILLRCALTGR